MVLEIKSHQWLSKAANDSEKFIEILKEVDGVCRRCGPTSPMICVEQCEIWKTKNEFLEMNGTLCANDYVHGLLNAVKNERRQQVIEALSEHPRTTKGLQEYLKAKGYYHSRRTIAGTYVEPLIEAGLVKKDSDKYRLTLYGQRFKQMLGRFNVEDSLPSHSQCYEEIVLRKLMEGPKNHSDLAELVPRNILSRTMQRLTEQGLVTKSKSSAYVFYLRTKKVPKKKFSPTEKRIYEAIPDAGIPTSELSEKASINLRRTYKYLRRLRKRKLVFTRKRPRTYELTPSGREVADFLEETASLILDASRASAFLLEHSIQTIAAQHLQC